MNYSGPTPWFATEMLRRNDLAAAVRWPDRIGRGDMAAAR